MATIPEPGVLIDEARAEAELEDFGDTWFLENLEALVPSLNAEAQLSEEGAATARGMIKGALVNRLRHVDLLKRHPEIRDEKVEVAAVVAGLPRTGSTMLHRMLASAPGMTGVRWYEAQNYVPLPGETRGDPEPRREAARGILAYMQEKIPDLMSIHPMSIDQPDEEVIIMGQLFAGTMIEGTYYVPSFARWISRQDRTRVYQDLKDILQSLQWQDPSRAGAKWVLKTPGHLMALDGLLKTFPGARVVMTHRDPVQTVPSYCSMEYSLYRMVSDTVTREEVGTFMAPRLNELLGDFMRVRQESGGANFIDVDYRDLLSQPIEQGSRVLEAAGFEVDEDVRGGMQQWIEANRREDRAPHKYSLADFGLERDQIEEMFSDYRAAFITDA